MKYFFLIVATLIGLLSCQPKNKYTIKGSIADTVESSVFLQKRINGEFVNIDTAFLIKGKFEMIGVVDIVDEYYISKGIGDHKLFFLENNEIVINSDSVGFTDAEIIGGPVQTLYNEYSEKYKRLFDYMLSEYYESVEEDDADQKMLLENRVDSLYEDIELFQKNFMLENLSTPVAAYILTKIQYGKTADELADMLNVLDGSLDYLNSYKVIAARIAALKKVSIGEKAPNFIQNDQNNTPISISEIYKRNKYTLLDFWASWCGPCREENPNVLSAYNKFKDNGFGVMGVSLDSKRGKWLKAIEEDSLNWIQVSDLRGWNNRFSNEYAVNSIPANFLIDSLGIIVAVELRGEELHSKLEELLK